MIAYGADGDIVKLFSESSCGLIIESETIPIGTPVIIFNSTYDDNGRIVFEYLEVINPNEWH